MGAPTQVPDSCNRLHLGATLEGVAKDRRAIVPDYKVGTRRAEARGILPSIKDYFAQVYTLFIASTTFIPAAWRAGATDTSAASTVPRRTE